MTQLMQSVRVGLPSLLLGLAWCAQAAAQNEFHLRVGMAGAGLNTWPAAEAPHFAIDGAGQKYLNFGRENTGFVVEPSFGSSVVDSLTIWTANDAEPRDPASYRLFGTNMAIDMFAGPGTAIPLSLFTEISAGDLSLPSTRNAGGGSPLLEANSQTVTFANTDAYSTYLVVFPTVKNTSANSMQIAEVALYAGNLPVFFPGDPILGVQLFPPVGDPVGPQPAPTQGHWSVREWRPYTTVNGTAGADAVIADPQWQFDGLVYDGMAQIINFFDPQNGGDPAGYSIPLAKQPFFSNTPLDDNDIVMRAIAKVIIPADGQYTFGIDGDDGTRLTVQGADFTYQGGAGGGMASGQILEFPNNTGNAFSLASTFLAAGQYDVELIWQERGGGAFVEVFAAPGIYNADSGVTPAQLAAAGFAPIGQREEVLVAQGMLPTIVGQWNVINVDVLDGTQLNNLANAQAAINGDFGEFRSETTASVINYHDPDNNLNAGTGGGRFRSDVPFPIDLPGDDNDFALQATATVRIAEDGDYIFGFGSDDGASLCLEGANFTIVNPGGVRAVTQDGECMEFNANTGNSDTFGTTFMAAGDYEISFLMWERAGGAWAEVYTAVGTTPQALLVSGRLLGSPAESFDVVVPVGLQLAGDAPPPMGIPGDYNDSGQVEQADLDLVLLNWGQPTPPVPMGWTNDLPIGAIDQEELDKVLLNWGNTAALGNTAAVPEPSTVVIVLVAAALALGLVRRR